jgi:SH3 domain
VNAVDAVVLYHFNGEHASELSVRPGQVIKIAPKEVQQLNRLLSTNWLLATSDGKNTGLIPVNYIKRNEMNQIMSRVNATSEIKQQQSQPVIVNEEPVPIIKSEETSTTTLTNDDEKSSVMV